MSGKLSTWILTSRKPVLLLGTDPLIMGDTGEFTPMNKLHRNEKLNMQREYGAAAPSFFLF